MNNMGLCPYISLNASSNKIVCRGPLFLTIEVSYIGWKLSWKSLNPLLFLHQFPSQALSFRIRNRPCPGTCPGSPERWYRRYRFTANHLALGSDPSVIEWSIVCCRVSFNSWKKWKWLQNMVKIWKIDCNLRVSELRICRVFSVFFVF